MAGRIGVLLRAVFVAILMWSGLFSIAHAEKRVALVVGNSAYRSVAPLKNPDSDAGSMADTLKTLGFLVVDNGAQFDLDKAGFDEVLHKFGDLLVGAGVALFYYAGHGIEAHGLNYLVPVDAHPVNEADIAGQLVDVSDVLQRMQTSGARINLVLLDACRDNPFKANGIRSGAGLVQMRAPLGTLISFATQPRSAALDGDDGHSPYTSALTETMRKPGFGLFKTFNEVGLAVERMTGGGQLPWVSSSPINGNFYFAGRPASNHAQPAQIVQDPAAAPAPAQQARLSPDDPLRRDLVTDCDRLAAMPNDTGHAPDVPGVERPDIKIAAATIACNDAMQLYPDVVRFAYQAGRVATAHKQWADARRLYDKAAAAGYAMAMNNIGGIHEGGEGVPINYAEAARWYGKAAAAGEPVAMTNLGWLYEKGLGVAKDTAQARRLYEQATVLGEPDGMNNLALLYMHGTGVSRDYAEARRLFEQCVALGDSACMNGLGALYNEGDGVARNRTVARHWFGKAAALGNREAKLNLGTR